MKIFELSFYQDQGKWKKINLAEVSKKNPVKVIDLIIYKKYYILIEKLEKF